MNGNAVANVEVAITKAVKRYFATDLEIASAAIAVLKDRGLEVAEIKEVLGRAVSSLGED